MSFDVWMENRTPFDAQTHVQVDADGQEVLVAMMSASFESPSQNSELAVAQHQTPVCFADVAFGDPALSSPRYEADIALAKPKSEIIINGTAYAPNGKAAREVQVGLQAAGLRKILNVIGDRIWSHGAFSAPQPFRTKPIIYERAYGGTTPEGKMDPRNPVGIGFEGALSADAQVKTQGPNIFYPGQEYNGSSDNPTPAGFGAMGRGWQPRISFAGTYDQDWLDNQWPLPPLDYDTRHNLCGPIDQQLDQLPPGATITLVNLTPNGRWQFRLPHIVAPVYLIFEDRIEEISFRPDTVLLEPDQWRITLKARLTHKTRRNAPKLREIVFGHVSPVWLNARRKQKRYINPLGGDGTLTDLPVWRP